MVKYYKYTCAYCKQEFTAENKVYNKKVKNSKTGKLFCSRDCFHKDRRHIDCFGYMIPKIKSRAKKFNRDFDLDAQYLRDMFNHQDGKCALSGIPLEQSFNHQDIENPFQISVDRIDNKKGYIKGNIRLVCLMINYARNGWDDTPFIYMCAKVYHKHFNANGGCESAPTPPSGGA